MSLLAHEPAFTSTGWLKSNYPPCALMETPDALMENVARIKERFHYCLLESLEYHLKKSDKLRHVPSLRLKQPQMSALAVLCSTRYGSIYFMSRAEARSLVPLLTELEGEIRAFSTVLDVVSCNQVMNAAVFLYFSSSDVHTDASPLPLPKWAFFTSSPRQVFGNADDLYAHTIDHVIQFPEPLYDLHDFAHLACASLSDFLYGAKYFRHFLALPEHYRNLIFHPGFTSSAPLGHADNLLFREFHWRYSMSSGRRAVDPKR